MFEIVDRDAGGRVSKLSVGNKCIILPDICVVINPNKLTIPIEELKNEFKAQILITNSYIISKHTGLREKVLKEGLHKFLGFDGLIYTDSGAFQYYSQGVSSIDPRNIVEFQRDIGSDFITPLDMFTEPNASHDLAHKNVNETLQRVNMARKLIKGRELVGPIQGGRHADLRKAACEGIAGANPDVFAIGGIVPLMEQYRFRDLAKIVMLCKQHLPAGVPVHAFGAGHPMVFSLLSALGVDIFDSAAYALYAEDGRYMTPYGTLKVSGMDYLPCECPVCSSHSPRELDVNLLARHNLYVTFAEIRAIKQAIHGGRLWQLLETRARAHPALFSAYEFLVSNYSFFEGMEPVTKDTPFFYFGRESMNRTDIQRAVARAQKISAKKKFAWFGKKIPDGLSALYPFSSSMPAGEQNKAFYRTKPLDILRATLEYQYGKKAAKVLSKEVRIEISRNTKRIRRVFLGDELLGTIRASDGFFIPTLFAAKKIAGAIGHGYSVMVSSDASEFIAEGKSVFAKFVKSAGNKIRPGDEVFVMDENKNVIACGTALLNAREMLEVKRGIAVRTRHS